MPVMSALTRTSPDPCCGATIHRIIAVWPSSVCNLASVVMSHVTSSPSSSPVTKTESPLGPRAKTDVEMRAWLLLKAATLSHVSRHTRQASFPVEARRLESGSKERLFIGSVCPRSTCTHLGSPLDAPTSHNLTVLSREHIANTFVEIETTETIDSG